MILRLFANILRCFPALVLAVGIVSVGLGLVEFFTQAADQFVAVQGAGR